MGKSSKTLPVDSSKFYHIAHVWDGKEHHIYWEGELFSKGTDGNGQLKTKGKCYLGATDTRFNYGGEINGGRDQDCLQCGKSAAGGCASSYVRSSCTYFD